MLNAELCRIMCMCVRSGSAEEMRACDACMQVHDHDSLISIFHMLSSSVRVKEGITLTPLFRLPLQLR